MKTGTREFAARYPVQDTIIRQFGGNFALGMIGIKKIMIDEDEAAPSVWVHHKTRGAHGEASFKVTYLPGDDLYEVSFFTVYGRELVAFNPVYADDLQALIEDTTGLALHIGQHGLVRFH